jgi:hypothetical protein
VALLHRSRPDRASQARSYEAGSVRRLRRCRGAGRAGQRRGPRGIGPPDEVGLDRLEAPVARRCLCPRLLRISGPPPHLQATIHSTAATCAERSWRDQTAAREGSFAGGGGSRRARMDEASRLGEATGGNPGNTRQERRPADDTILNSLGSPLSTEHIWRAGCTTPARRLEQGGYLRRSVQAHWFVLKGRSVHARIS